MVIFIVISLYYGGELLGLRKFRLMIYHVIVLGILIIPAIGIGKRIDGRKFFLYEPNVYQWAFNAIGDKVDLERKVLILPYIFYSNDKALKREYYFGDNAIYVKGLPFTGMTFSDMIF